MSKLATYILGLEVLGVIHGKGRRSRKRQILLAPESSTNTMSNVRKALDDNIWLFCLRHNNKFLATVWAT